MQPVFHASKEDPRAVADNKATVRTTRARGEPRRRRVQVRERDSYNEATKTIGKIRNMIEEIQREEERPRTTPDLELREEDRPAGSVPKPIVEGEQG